MCQMQRQTKNIFFLIYLQSIIELNKNLTSGKTFHDSTAEVLRCTFIKLIKKKKDQISGLHILAGVVQRCFGDFSFQTSSFSVAHSSADVTVLNCFLQDAIVADT